MGEAFFVTQLVTQGSVMRQKKVPNLYIRNGTYYFRYRFSTAVRQKLEKWEYCKSLHTKDFDKASLISIRLRIQAKALEKSVGDMKKEQLTKEKVDELIQWYFSENYEDSDTLLGMDMERQDVDLSGELVDETEWKAKLTSEIVSRKYSLVTVSDAEELLELHGMEKPNKGVLWWELLHGIARARYELYRIYIETIKGNFHERAIKDHLFINELPTHSSELITPLNNSDKSSNTVAALIDKYVTKKSKSGWTNKTIEENTRCLVWLEGILGSKDLKSVSKENMRNFRDMIELIPKNYMKKPKLKNLPIQEAVKVNNGKDVISSATAYKYWGVVCSFMNWAKKEGYFDNLPSPAQGLEIVVKKKAMDAKDPFSNEQLKKWFTSPIYSGCLSPTRRLKSGDIIIEDALYWVPLIGLYTGMRLGEIIQMSMDDLEDVKGIWAFNVREDPDDINKSVKTPSSVRKVPLHNDLLEFGFIQFFEDMKKKGYKRIFEDINPSSKGYYSDLFSKKFRYNTEKLNIKTAKTSYHSFRHNIKNAMKDKDILDTHQDAILGHAQTAMNAIYGSTEVKKLKECIDRIEYEIDLTHLRKNKSLF